MILAVLVLQSGGEAPETQFAHVATQTPLRSGPGEGYPGVITLDEGDVVRLGEAKGRFVEVFVAGGYPAYVHKSLGVVNEVERLVTITAQRVNLRVLPATVGSLPIGQVNQDAAPLVLLDEEGNWLRVLAPVTMPLYGDGTAFTAMEGGAGSKSWLEGMTSREIRRRFEISAWKTAHPEWTQQEDLFAEVLEIAEIDFTLLDAVGLESRRNELAVLQGGATWPETIEAVAEIENRIQTVKKVREEVARSIEEIRQQEALESASIAREARILNLGLSFRGRGEALQVEGTVNTQEGDGGAAIFLMTTENGETLKLSANGSVASLSDVVGQKVTVDGRRLTLAAVRGPVLICDRVVVASP